MARKNARPQARQKRAKLLAKMEAMSAMRQGYRLSDVTRRPTPRLAMIWAAACAALTKKRRLNMSKYKVVDYCDVTRTARSPAVVYYVADGDELVRSGERNFPVEFTDRGEAEVYAALLNAVHDEEEAAAKRALWLDRAGDVGALAFFVALVAAGFSLTDMVNAWVLSWR